MKTYKIFLASSAELAADRRAFEVFIGRENKRLKENNVFLHLEIWEDSGEALSQTRSQDEYNRLLLDCDLFVMLYWTKVGKYTNEEFDLARAQFLSAGQPLKIYTYCKTIAPPASPSPADTDSLRVFGGKLHGISHFPIHYDSPEGLQLHFGTRLKDLFADGTLPYGDMAKCLSAGQPAVPEGFIGREDELTLIRRKMEAGGTLMLINSEGGMGKTSIAAKYWADHLYQYTHNAWLFCENGIVEELKKLAPALGLDLAQLPESQHVAALRMAMQNLPPDCLLVLDNANTPEDIRAFRQGFSGLHWHVLITSRCQQVLEKQQELAITHLPPHLAKALFTSHYTEQTPDFDALLDRLLVAIGYNTLLIELFAKNMAELAATGETMRTFLTRVEETLFLRDWSFAVITPYTTHVQKEAATTDAIIDALYDLNQLAEAERFRLVNMALLPAESHLLTVLIDLFAPDDKMGLRNQLAGLAQKGWLTTDTQSYRLSPVVQKLVLAKNKASLWADGKALVERLTAVLKLEQNKDNVTTKFKWLIYAQPLQTQFAESSDLAFSAFQNNLALVLKDLGGEGNLLQAQGLLEAALANAIANEQAPVITISQSNLATVLRDLGGDRNLLQARGLLEVALVNNIANYGEQAPAVAVNQSNLALVLQSLGGEGNLLQARGLLEVALVNNIANYGEQAPAVAVNQSNLALVLQSLGGDRNLLQARGLLESALANAIANFGEQAPTVAVRQSNLAMVLQSLGGDRNLLQARGLLESALANDIANFGEQAPTVAVRQSNLAIVLQSLGDREKACQLWLQAYWIFRNAFSEEYGNTQTVLKFLRSYCPECFEQQSDTGS